MLSVILEKKYTNNKTHNSSHPSNKSNKWYNNDCKTAKQDFANATRSYKQNKSHENKLNFVRTRSKLNKAKRRAKAIHQFEQGQLSQNWQKKIQNNSGNLSKKEINPVLLLQKV